VSGPLGWPSSWATKASRTPKSEGYESRKDCSSGKIKILTGWSGLTSLWSAGPALSDTAATTSWQKSHCVRFYSSSHVPRHCPRCWSSFVNWSSAISSSCEGRTLFFRLMAFNRVQNSMQLLMLNRRRLDGRMCLFSWYFLLLINRSSFAWEQFVCQLENLNTEGLYNTVYIVVVCGLRLLRQTRSSNVLYCSLQAPVGSVLIHKYTKLQRHVLYPSNMSTTYCIPTLDH
jgi:hypothetical protein